MGKFYVHEVIDLDEGGQYRLYCRLRHKTLKNEGVIYPALWIVDLDKIKIYGVSVRLRFRKGE